MAWCGFNCCLLSSRAGPHSLASALRGRSVFPLQWLLPTPSFQLISMSQIIGRDLLKRKRDEFHKYKRTIKFKIVNTLITFGFLLSWRWIKVKRRVFWGIFLGMNWGFSVHNAAFRCFRWLTLRKKKLFSIQSYNGLKLPFWQRIVCVIIWLCELLVKKQ